MDKVFRISVAIIIVLIDATNPEEEDVAWAENFQVVLTVALDAHA
jgi:hypothetical protein